MTADTNVTNVNKRENGIVRYFKDIKSEFKKITWPSKADLLKSTEIALVVIALFTLIIWAFDSAFGSILKGIMSYLK